MALSFSFAQAHKLLRQRFGSLVKIALASAFLTLASAVVAIGYYGVTAEIEQLSGNLIISVFAAARADSSEAVSIFRQVRSAPEVANAELVTPAQAQKEFAKSVGQKLDNLLPNNPFPSVIKVRLLPASCSRETLESVIRSFRQIPLVDDVVYNAAYANALFSRSRQTSVLIFGGAIGVFAVFLFILYFALRAETSAGGDEVHILMLLGATRGFVAMPHILFDIYACTIGLVLGSGMTVGGYFLAKPMIGWLDTVPPMYLELCAGAVIFLSIILSVWTAYSVKKK
jgi:cell division protein FtsX